MSKRFNRDRIRRSAAIAALAVFAFVSDPAFAATTGGGGGGPAIAPSPCDAEYYKSLNARAWLEAQREITQNQNLIYKPDSVLEYTCFNRQLNVLALQATSMFSETTRWGSDVLGSDQSRHMDDALEDLVEAAVVSYIDANFEDFNLLGARFNSSANSGYAPANLDHAFPASVTGGGYACDIMNQVWAAAKCGDFIANNNEDGFFTFAQYQASPDKRFLPQRCTAIGARWDLEMRASTGINTPWIEDTFATRIELFIHNLPGAPGCQHLAPVPTGLQVFSKEFETYEEMVCFAPGCYYQPPSGGTGTGSCRISNN